MLKCVYFQRSLLVYTNKQNNKGRGKTMLSIWQGIIASLKAIDIFSIILGIDLLNWYFGEFQFSHRGCKINYFSLVRAQKQIQVQNFILVK